MSDDLRIDLALARAAGLPLRSANDASAPAADMALPGRASDPLFSPLALLLAHFLPPAGAPAPAPTPDEARLLHAYLQQRVVAALRADGLNVFPTVRVAIERDGSLQLSPVPGTPERIDAALHRDPDIARLVAVLQRAVADVGERIEDPTLAELQAQDPLARPVGASADVRRAWFWRTEGEGALEMRGLPSRAPLFAAAAAALVLAWWLFT